MSDDNESHSELDIAIDKKRKELNALIEKKDKAEAELIKTRIDNTIGHCFQDEMYDNNFDRQYCKVLGRFEHLFASKDVWVFRIIVPKSIDEEKDEVFEAIKLEILEDPGFDKEIPPKAFQKKFDAVMSKLVQCGITLDLELCTKSNIKFEISK